MTSKQKSEEELLDRLEELIEPYWIGGAASSEFTDYDEYRHNGITAKLDTGD